MTPEQKARRNAMVQNEHIEFLHSTSTAGGASGADDIDSNLRNELRLLKEEYFLRSAPIINQLVHFASLRPMQKMVIDPSKLDPAILPSITPSN